MRVLMVGRRAVTLVVTTGFASVLLVSGAASTHGASASVVLVPSGTIGVVLGPATAYVRGSDGVVRRVR